MAATTQVAHSRDLKPSLYVQQASCDVAKRAMLLTGWFAVNLFCIKQCKCMQNKSQSMHAE